MNKAWSVNVCLGNDSTAETRLALAAQTLCAPNNTNYHLHVIIIAGLSSNVSGQSPSYTYKSDAIQKQAANTR